LTGNTTNHAGQVATSQYFDIENLKGLDEEIVESEQRDDGVSASNPSVQAHLLQGSRVDCVVS
jgi:hypothetical protein